MMAWSLLEERRKRGLIQSFRLNCSKWPSTLAPERYAARRNLPSARWRVVRLTLFLVRGVQNVEASGNCATGPVTGSPGRTRAALESCNSDRERPTLRHGVPMEHYWASGFVIFSSFVRATRG